MPRASPDPFVVSTVELFRHRGARHGVTLEGALTDVELSSARLTADDIHVEATLEAQGSVVTVTGEATGRWTGECRRCLGSTGGTVRVELHEVFEPEPVEGETYPLGRDDIDLAPALREAFALALPLAPLCDVACAGPDPDAHPVRTEDEDATPRRDPRWAALDELRFDR